MLDGGREYQLRATLSGRVVTVSVKPGDKVNSGDTLVILESMKLEHSLKASHDGVVKSVRIKQGEIVAAKAILLEMIR